jgi:hypothetical protein
MVRFFMLPSPCAMRTQSILHHAQSEGLRNFNLTVNTEAVREDLQNMDEDEAALREMLACLSAPAE